MKFSGFVRQGSKNNLEHNGGVAFNLVDTELFPYFLGVMSVSHMVKNDGSTFIRFSEYVGHDTRTNWIDCFMHNFDCFTLLKLLATLRKSGWMNFIEYFRKGRMWYKEQHCCFHCVEFDKNENNKAMLRWPFERGNHRWQVDSPHRGHQCV